MKATYIIITLALILGSISGMAQVSIGGELRPRTEFSHGYGTLANASQTPSIFTSQRTRVNLAFQSELLSSKIILQDVRIWGSQAQLVNNEDYAVSIHEAWAESKLYDNWSLKAGRQELVYDDSRIFGNVGWAQQGRSHDLALLKFRSSLEFHIGLALNQNSNRSNNIFDGDNAYKAMQFLWVNKKLDNLSLSVLALNNGVAFNETDHQQTVYSQTLGTHVIYKWGNQINIVLNAYYQGGNVVFQNAINSLSAYNFLAEANYTTGDLVFTMGDELLSGNDVADNSKVQSFTPLYGTNHKFNGHMDYFYVGNHANSVGLNDAYVKGMYTKEKHSTAVHVHVFSTAAATSSGDSGFLGTEVDCSYAYSISPDIQFSIGYSQLYATNLMESLRGGDARQIQNWAYLMFTFQPKYLK